MPTALTMFATALPLVDPAGSGLHDFWGMHNTTTMAALCLTVVTRPQSSWSACRYTS